MSRIGKKPIPIPDKTTVSIEGNGVSVKGEKGTLTGSMHPAVDLIVEDGQVKVRTVQNDRKSRAIHGLVRSLVNNMVIGVSRGFERVLEINGIGYRAEVSGRSMSFSLGYSHPVRFDLPDGISATVEKNTVIKLSGIDKELLGHTAAAIRMLRPPEPYRGKGIKYAEERIQRKAGKAGTK
jgi:large subunit ribosomal protein L6